MRSAAEGTPTLHNARVQKVPGHAVDGEHGTWYRCGIPELEHLTRSPKPYVPCVSDLNSVVVLQLHPLAEPPVLRLLGADFGHLLCLASPVHVASRVQAASARDGIRDARAGRVASPCGTPTMLAFYVYIYMCNIYVYNMYIYICIHIYNLPSSVLGALSMSPCRLCRANRDTE